ncbi:hypothetical protein [Streptomyces sp. SID13031]|uniref:hypothetical protein n=1 Tax=Streptomyces sp. SID13031 TaxID=2706046 RepID=UPI0013CA56DB|nr:hypothetical protein [Streptomyces sp. SID13031]NEA34147.1 hypothetical protein [Streptomyces sp. SID13031]
MADRFDLDAIEADDALLDLLAAGGESAWAAGEHDPVLMMLAELRLAVEVEDELPVETIDDPESFLARCAALNPVTDPFARKLAARSLALGVAAVAALSVSGVAAAVTGNPLSPYEKVIEKIADGLRPETSLPKEQLDGLPAFDKTKIVKVGKDYQATQQRNAEKAKEPTSGGVDTPPASNLLPPLARPAPLPQTDQQLQIETQAVAPVVPEQPAPVVPPPSEPTTQPTEPGPTGEPTAPPTGEPTQEPTAPPSSEPTQEPTAPPSSEPTQEPTAPTTTPAPGGGDNGSTGNPGEGPTDAPTPPVTEPTKLPTTVPSTGDGGETSTGTENGGDETTPVVPPKTDEPSPDLPGDQTGDEGNQGTDNPISEVLGSVVPVLPTPTGAPIEEPVRLEQYFGKGFTDNGKHSSGKPALGWAKSQYAKGKHSTGQYAEGKHAATNRAHGSMAPVTIRQILGVLNTPMSDR